MRSAFLPIPGGTALRRLNVERFSTWRCAPIIMCIVLTIVAFALRLGLAIVHPSIFRPDEVFQSLEPAHGLLSGHWIAAWEWLEGARSWLLPYIVVGPMAVGRALGFDAPAQIAATWALFAGVGASTVVAAFALGFRHHGLLGGTLCGAVCATWPDLVYFGPKTLTEIQGGHLLVLAVCVAALPQRPGTARLYPGWWRGVAVGLLLGWCFCIRFPLAPGIVITAFWFGRRNIWRCWVPMAVGAAVPLLVTAATDLLTWGWPFFPIWKQTQVFGAPSLGEPMPWTGYLRLLVWEWGPAIALIAVPFVVGVRRCIPLALPAIAVVLSHSAIPYKEINYIYAATELILIIAAIGTADIVARLTVASGGRLQRQFVGRLAILTWLIIAASVNGSASFTGYWFGKHDAIAAATVLRKSADLCGLGLLGVPWQATGGYAWMNRSAPTYAVPDLDHFAQMADGFNYIIVPASVEAIGVHNFATSECGSTMCVMHRAGTCTESPGFKSNLQAGQLRP